MTYHSFFHIKVISYKNKYLKDKISKQNSTVLFILIFHIYINIYIFNNEIMIYKKNNYNYNKQKTNNFIIFQTAIYLLSNNLITRLKEKVAFQQFH